MKLIRDKIPDIPNINRRYRFQQVKSNKQYLEALKQKLVEESKEAAATRSENELILELVDVTEIVEEIKKLLGVSASSFNQLRKKKLKEKGGFSKRLMMISR